MSGPKVVVIVTREEIVVICQGLLAQLEDAIERWQHTGERQNLFGNKEIEEVLRRRDKIRTLLESDQFMELQKQVPQEIAFLQADIDHRLDRRAAIEADRRTGSRRVANAAASLLVSLESAQIKLPNDLRHALEDAKANAKGGKEVAERAIAQGIGLLVPEKLEGALNEQQHALAKRLGEGERTTVLSEWLAGQSSPADDLERKIETYIARLEGEEGPEAAVQYSIRAKACIAEPSSSRRRLLADSLILDLAKEAATRKERAQVLATLSALSAEISGLGRRGGTDLVARIDSVKRNGDSRAADSLIGAARSFIESERKVIAATSRRKSVLTALSRLGYEVREGMETAWIESNRVVLRKVAAPDYGLELSGKAETGRLQFRVVGYSSPSQPRTPARDKNMEVIWCSELDELKSLLAKSGSELTVERAVVAGEQPVKEVLAPAQATNSRRDETRTSSNLRRHEE